MFLRAIFARFMSQWLTNGISAGPSPRIVCPFVFASSLRMVSTFGRTQKYRS